MLLVHPDSQCDVCLDPYLWDTNGKVPHAIACGHIFCLQCLRHCRPSTCPLCRKEFAPDRIKKLHIDRHTGPAGDNPAQREATRYMESLALMSTDSDRQSEGQNLLEEVNDWLDNHRNGSNDFQFPALRALWATRVKYAELQGRHIDLQVTYERAHAQVEDFEAKLRRRDEALEEEGRKTRLVEERLMKELEECRRELEQWHRNFPAYAQAQSHNQQPGSNDTSFETDDERQLQLPTPTTNPLPPPPKPFRIKYDHLYNRYDQRQTGSGAPSGTSYKRTSIPPLKPMSNFYNPEELTGSGAIIMEGATEKDAVYPPRIDFGLSRNRSRGREGENGEGRERRRHRRDRRENETEQEREERHRRRRRERAHQSVPRDVVGESALSGDTISPGNALGIGPNPAPANPVAHRSTSGSEGYLYALQPPSPSGEAGPSTMVYIGGPGGHGSSTTSFNYIGRGARSNTLSSANPSEADAARVPRTGGIDMASIREAQWAMPPPVRPSTSSTSNHAGQSQPRPDMASTNASLSSLGLINTPSGTSLNAHTQPSRAAEVMRSSSNFATPFPTVDPAPAPSIPAPQGRTPRNSSSSWGTSQSVLIGGLVGLPQAPTDRNTGSESLDHDAPVAPWQPYAFGIPAPVLPQDDILAGTTPTAPSAMRTRTASFAPEPERPRTSRRDSQPSRPGTSHGDRERRADVNYFYTPSRPQTRQGREAEDGHARHARSRSDAHSAVHSQTSLSARSGSRSHTGSLAGPAAPPVLTQPPGWPYAPGAPEMLYRSAASNAASSLSSLQSLGLRAESSRPH